MIIYQRDIFIYYFDDLIVGEDRVTTWFNFQLEDGTITKDVLISYDVKKIKRILLFLLIFYK